ncbi:unnamed protein product, partial [Polarella glacialis]
CRATCKHLQVWFSRMAVQVCRAMDGAAESIEAVSGDAVLEEESQEDKTELDDEHSDVVIGFQLKSSKDDENDFLVFFPRSRRLQRFIQFPVRFKDIAIEKQFIAKSDIRTSQNLVRMSYFVLAYAVASLVTISLAASGSMPWLETVEIFHYAMTFGVTPITFCLAAQAASKVTIMSLESYMTCLAVFTTFIFMIGSRTRAAYIFGADPEVVWTNVDPSFTSDSLIIGTLSISIPSFYSMLALRSAKLFPLLFAVPVAYLALSLPIPQYSGLEGAIVRRVALGVILFIQNVVGLFGRARSELSEREVFFVQVNAENGHMSEKALRYAAEQHVEG